MTAEAPIAVQSALDLYVESTSAFLRFNALADYEP